jgi:hypothetical protein
MVAGAVSIGAALALAIDRLYFKKNYIQTDSSSGAKPSVLWTNGSVTYPVNFWEWNATDKDWYTLYQ